MKYLKTNEGLFTGKSEKIFDKVIINLKKRLTDDDEYEIENFDGSKMFFGRSAKHILKKAFIRATRGSYEYEIGIILVKEGVMDKPFLHSIVLGYRGDKTDSAKSEATHVIFSDENAYLTTYELIDMCKGQLDLKKQRNSETKNFFENYPIEDIKDHLVELSDTYGKYTIHHSGPMERTPSYNIIFDEDHIFSEEVDVDHYSHCSDDLVSLLTEINSLSKTFSSMGLDLIIDLYGVLNSGSIDFYLFEKKD